MADRHVCPLTLQRLVKRRQRGVERGEDLRRANVRRRHVDAVRGAVRGARRRQLRLRVRQLVLFLPLHAPVLEPDLDLPLGEAERVRDLDAPSARQVAVEVELLLQLEHLVARVGGARPLVVAVERVRTCNRSAHWYTGER